MRPRITIGLTVLTLLCLFLAGCGNAGQRRDLAYEYIDATQTVGRLSKSKEARRIGKLLDQAMPAGPANDEEKPFICVDGAHDSQRLGVVAVLPDDAKVSKHWKRLRDKHKRTLAYFTYCPEYQYIGFYEDRIGKWSKRARGLVGQHEGRHLTFVIDGEGDGLPQRYRDAYTELAAREHERSIRLGMGGERYQRAVDIIVDGLYRSQGFDGSRLPEDLSISYEDSRQIDKDLKKVFKWESEEEGDWWKSNLVMDACFSYIEKHWRPVESAKINFLESAELIHYNAEK